MDGIGMNGQMDGHWIIRWMDIGTNGQTDKWTDGWMDGWMDIIG